MLIPVFMQMHIPFTAWLCQQTVTVLMKKKIDFQQLTVPPHIWLQAFSSMDFSVKWKFLSPLLLGWLLILWLGKYVNNIIHSIILNSQSFIRSPLFHRSKKSWLLIWYAGICQSEKWKWSQSEKNARIVGSASCINACFYQGSKRGNKSSLIIQVQYLNWVSQ